MKAWFFTLAMTLVIFFLRVFLAFVVGPVLFVAMLVGVPDETCSGWLDAAGRPWTAALLWLTKWMAGGEASHEEES